jgi:CRISPR-associated protein Csb2
MLAIEVEFLMGRAMATQLGERDAAEWPPHPQRLFSALVAAQSELEIGKRGEAALRWLESLPPPDIRADMTPSFRQVHSHWVPVNDETIKVEKGKADFRNPLERRNRQERFFPAVVPKDPTMVFQWSHADGIETHLAALTTLVENICYLGHSASPVRACLRKDLVEPTLTSSPDGTYILRVPGPGRLARLEGVHHLRLDDETVQPPLGRVVGYETVKRDPHTVFSPQAFVIAFESGPKLGLDSTLPLLRHFRDALLSRINNAAPTSLSGHDKDGRPGTEPHLAFVPMGFVNSKYADGSLKGIALVLPRGMESGPRRRLQSAIEGAWQLHLGVLGSITVRLNDEPLSDLESLRFSQYAAKSTVWASVTPIALDRHPKKKGPTAESIVAESCVRIGLPAPVEVRLGTVSAVSGAPRAQEFHGQSKQTEGRPLRHALLRFACPVRGPVLLGAGRFTGLGLCVPYSKRVRP